jgi:hypothetical protein
VARLRKVYIVIDVYVECLDWKGMHDGREGIIPRHIVCSPSSFEAGEYDNVGRVSYFHAAQEDV